MIRAYLIRPQPCRQCCICVLFRPLPACSLPDHHPDTLTPSPSLLQAAKALDRNRLSHTERLLQSTQDLVKQSESKKGARACGAPAGRVCGSLLG